MGLEPRVIVAMDFPDSESALALAARLDPGQCRLKVGKELFTRGGPAVVEKLRRLGFDLFLDLKFHDIPNTVAAACDAAADLGVWMLNVHASGGRAMMRAAVERLHTKAQRPLLIGVTLLTSLGQQEQEEVGLAGTAEQAVLRLTRLALASGLDGVVCSPREVAGIRRELGDRPLLVTPGVRPADAALDDQRRVMTPQDAIAAGSSYLVIGRPVTAASDPVKALQAINDGLAAAAA